MTFHSHSHSRLSLKYIPRNHGQDYLLVLRFAKEAVARILDEPGCGILHSHSTQLVSH